MAPAARLAPQVVLATAKGTPAAILPSDSATFWRFDTVTVLAALVVPTLRVQKLNELDDSVTGATPVPERPTVCGLFGASSLKVKAPVIEPGVVGENVTPTVQLAPDARLAPHVLLATEKPALVVMLAMLRVTV